MNAELVRIPTDTEPLDGLLYEPPVGPPRAAVLLFHGNVSNFYSGPSRFVPPLLIEMGFACLAFNRRGHDILTNREGKLPGGGAFQTAGEGIADNEYASEFLRERIPMDQVVIGHSNGGMLGAEFAATHPDVRALVLLSAHAGGSGTYLRSCRAGMMAGEDDEEVLAAARAMIEDGRRDELLLMPGWHWVISAASLVDRHENTPDLIENARRIRCPSLFVVGGLEATETYPAEEYGRNAAGPCEVRILENGDHWYRGMQDEVGRSVAEWVDQVI